MKEQWSYLTLVSPEFLPLSSPISPQARVCGWTRSPSPHPPGFPLPVTAFCTLPGSQGKWKEPALEEEAEAQLMVPNSGRHVSGWKNREKQGAPGLHPSEAVGRLEAKSSERGRASEEKDLLFIPVFSLPHLPAEPRGNQACPPNPRTRHPGAGHQALPMEQLSH